MFIGATNNLIGGNHDSNSDGDQAKVILEKATSDNDLDLIFSTKVTAKPEEG